MRPELAHVVALITLACCSAAYSDDSRTPAFPGAQGAGMHATGGRGGQVAIVTNLNPDGPGSLADALSQPNRIVVFAVSGIIDLSKVGKPGKEKPGKIEITHPNITIAGQTAPGEGICLKGGPLQIHADNVIVRHIRSRRGWNFEGDTGDAIEFKARSLGEASAPGGQTQEAFDKRMEKKEERGKFVHEFADMTDVIVDHCSTSWATDENLTCTHVDRATLSWCIAAEGLDYTNPKQTPPNHSEGGLWGSGAPDGRATLHHTLYAHNRLRNPRLTGGNDVPAVLTMYNCVVYDWSEYATHTGSESVHFNWMNNLQARPQHAAWDRRARLRVSWRPRCPHLRTRKFHRRLCRSHREQQARRLPQPEVQEDAGRGERGHESGRSLRRAAAIDADCAGCVQRGAR